jgi:hypothetical protein
VAVGVGIGVVVGEALLKEAVLVGVELYLRYRHIQNTLVHQPFDALIVYMQLPN